MMDQPLWPHQERALVDVRAAIAAGQRRICLTAPTGAGKSRTLSEMILDDVANNLKSVVYTNRKALVEQLSRTLTKFNIDHGIRAADYTPRLGCDVQISSIMTENSRVLRKEEWELHDGDRIYVDELHINKSEVAEELQRRHLQKPGSVFVGLTATPIEIDNMCDYLVIGGTKKECRDCGALVLARHFGVDEPDMRKYKPNVKTGEYSEKDVIKAVMTKNVFGRVWEHWTALNPERKPTILFAPGVKESIWFCERFMEKGVSTAHIDGTQCWINGEYFPTTTEVRDQIAAASKSGDIKLVSNRFVMREGIDWPWLEVGVLATVFGSLQTNLQSGGRLLRSSPGKTEALIIDHGGNWHRHGSLNVDIQWTIDNTERMIQGVRADRLREKREPEPIRCPKCSMVRARGSICPGCGYESTKRSRMVVQQDGTLVEHTGDIYKPRRISMRNNTIDLWKRMYQRGLRTDMTFSQCRGLFYVENFYYPPQDIPFMPSREVDWYKRVKDVDVKTLVGLENLNKGPRQGSLYE
jgi:DNA repair protein RadD